MAFELPPLPYPDTALDPFLSAEQMRFHHGKHHQAYVSTLNKLVKDSPLGSKSLEEIVRLTIVHRGRMVAVVMHGQSAGACI